MRTCLKRYARSPVIDERLSRVMKSRRSRSSRTGSRSSTSGSRRADRALPEDPADHGGALEQPLLVSPQPVDAGRDHRLQRVRDPLRRCRPRAASASSPRRRAGCPRSSRAASSARRPRARGRRAARRAAPRSPPGASGSSSVAAARTRPPPQLGRMSSSSGRARQRIISGASLTRSARCSISSSSGSSAQCTSSKTRISGLASASSAAHSRAAQAISCWLRSVSIPSSTPTASASRSATASSPQLGAQLRDRLLNRVVVGDPGRDLDHLGERPVGDALAVRERAADEDARAPRRPRGTRARAGSCRRRARRRS